MKYKQKPFYLLMVLALLAGLIGFQPAQPAEAALPTDLFFSEYIEGGSYNKAIEIYNGTGADVDLTGYDVELYSNGSPTVSQSVTLTGTLLNGDVYVIAHKDAIQAILDQADLQNSTIANWNGDDAIVLRAPDDSVLDVFGVIGTDPGTSWGTGDYTTHDHTLVRDPDICGGDPDGTDAFDPSVEWISFPKDTTTELGSHTSYCVPYVFSKRFIISEYIEGSNNNKAIELYNGTGADIDLQNYKLNLYTNGSTTPSTNSLAWTEETILADGDTYVIANSGAIAGITALADIFSTVTYFNGDDALVLYEITPEGDIVRDSFGRLGEDPGTSWGTGTDTATAERTLVRKETVCQGDILPDDVFEPSLEYNGFAADTYANLGSHTMSCGPADLAPKVASTVPADGAVNVAVDANIVITFSEPVAVTDPDLDPWFSISCTESGPHAAAVTDADTVFTLDPVNDFVTGETCEVTVLAANVSDDDTDDPPDTMDADHVFTFDTISVCGDNYTPIFDIQGSGAASPLVGETVTTEGVVVGDFQSGGKNGFFIQDETGDGDDATSDGIFVDYASAPDVKEGDKIRLTGLVNENYGLTRITGSFLNICSNGNTITPLELSLPFESTNHEHLEGMLVTFPQALVISEYFNFDRYGELLLTSERHSTPTAVVEPGQDAIDLAAYHELDSIAVDDGSSYQNPSFLRHPDGSAFGLDHYFRGGDTVAGLTGVMDYNFDEYKIQPVGTATYEAVNLRTDAPELVPGEIRIASLNVLNYFTTLDGGSKAWICGPSGDMECRGADANQPLELERQQVKIVNAILGMDADIVGLMEIENEHPGQLADEPVISLVDLLNEATEPGMYSYIATGPIGTDAIKQAILYKTEKVEVVGDFAVLDSSVDPRFDTDLNRPSLVQTFMDKITSEIFTVSVNHLKSKGSACPDDPDLGDGAGNCNLTRKAAAKALVEWLETDPTATGSDMYVIIGDLNSYAMEDPIDMIKLGADDLPDTADDYYNLVDRFREPAAYGYVYDGQTGYLDHALGNRKFASYVLDANFWHINADEADVFDYDTSYKPDLVDAMFDPTTPYRSSDHDPVLISVLLNHPPVATDDTYTTPAGTVLEVAAPGVLTNDTDVNIYDNITASLVADSGPLHGELVFNEDGSFTYTPDPGFAGEDTFEYVMHATPGLMINNADTATVTILVTERLIFLPLIFK